MTDVSKKVLQKAQYSQTPALQYIDDDGNFKTMTKSELPGTTEQTTDLINAVKNLAQASVDVGVATHAVDTTTIRDDDKHWPADAFVKLVVEITSGTGEGEMRRITTNDATTLTVSPAFSVTPDGTSQYRIAFFGKMAGDITHIGGESQTGVDWTPILQSLNDDQKTGLLKSIGDITTGESFMTRLGARADSAQTTHTETDSLLAFVKGAVQLLGETQNVGADSVYGSVSVSDSATAIHVGEDNLAGRHSVLMVNTDGALDVHVGFDNAVTESNGIPLKPGDERWFEVDDSVTLHGIAPSTETVDVRVAEMK